MRRYKDRGAADLDRVLRSADHGGANSLVGFLDRRSPGVHAIEQCLGCIEAGGRLLFEPLRAAQLRARINAYASVIAGIERLRARLGENPEYGAEHPLHTNQSAADKLETGMHGLGTYHTRPIVSRGNELMLTVQDVKLLYYYQNRTAHIPEAS